MPRASPPPVPAYVSAFSSQWPRQTEDLEVHHQTVGSKPFLGKCKLTSSTKTSSGSEPFIGPDKSVISPNRVVTVTSASPSISIPRSTASVSNGLVVERESLEKDSSLTRSHSGSNLYCLDSIDTSITSKPRQMVSSSPVPSFTCPTSFSSWKLSMDAMKQATPSARSSPLDSSLSRYANSAPTWESFKTPVSWGAQVFSGNVSYDSTVQRRQDDLFSVDIDDSEKLASSNLEPEDVFSMELDDVPDCGPRSFLAKLAQAVANPSTSPRVFVTSVVPSLAKLGQHRKSSSPRKAEPYSSYFGKKSVAGVPVKPQTSGLGLSETELFEQAKSKYEVFRQPRVVHAWNIAVDAHRGQFRRNGEAYSIHCLETGVILAELGLDENAVIAGLLHDTLDDTHVNVEFLQREFGFDIANLVTQVSKVSRINELMRRRTSPISSEEFDSLNKMLLAMITDIRVVIIKMADRLHNMRTIHALPHEKRQRMARDSLDIYVPLANRLGIWQMKAELEDLCFEVLHPEACRKIRASLENNTSMASYLSSAVKTLHKSLESEGIHSELYGRTKSLYSIFKKMKKKQRGLKEIFDVRAIRVIVETVEECYQVLEKVHQLWKPIHAEFNDYIQQPKPNNYQSLHTAVIGDNECPVEVQIRTKEMHQLAEYGIAAHWKYKEQRSDKSHFVDEKIQWLRSMLEWRQRVMTSASMPDAHRGKGYPPMRPYPKQDTIVVATHGGEILELPVGSSVRDAATAIDPRNPSQLWSVKVNDRAVDPMYHLRDGDLVQIISCVPHSNPVPRSPSTKPSLPVLAYFLQ